MDISTIANVATAVTVLTGVIFGWFEVRHFRREREERAAFDLAERAAARWGTPIIEPTPGACDDCAFFVPLDGEGHLLDYGACMAESGPFDGRIVRGDSGCPSFRSGEER